MKKSFSSLLALLFLPLLALAQLVSVPKNVYFADIHLRISDGAQEEIQKKVDALHRNKTYFKIKVDLADAYFPIIERVFKEEGVPDDYKYLALQESGLLGDAVSTSNAVGYWQFKREAALDFNLRMDNKIDERRHIVEASRGAAKYFLRSNNYYNNWFNSLLSYYLGYTGAKAYTSSSDNGAKKMDVTEKSHPYVITFLAHKIAYDAFVGKANPPALSLREMRGTPGQSLADIAMATQTDYAELEKYNKWLLGSSIPSDKDYYVMVPVRNGNSDAGLLASKDTAAPAAKAKKGIGAAIMSKRNGLSTITARPGDTKDKLALKAGISTRKFLKYNDMHNFDEIVAGSVYYLEKKNMNADVEYHVVQAGETMQLISQHYGIRLNYLLFKNRMNRNEVPVPGRVLWLQKRRPAHTPVEIRNLNKKQAATATATAPIYNRPEGTATNTRVEDDEHEEKAAQTTEAAPKENIFRRFINSFKRFKKPQPAQQQEEVVEEEEVVVAEKTAVVTPAPAPAASTTTPVVEKARPAEDGWIEAAQEEEAQAEKEVKTETKVAATKVEAVKAKEPAKESQEKKVVLYPQANTVPAVKEPAQQSPVDTLPAPEPVVVPAEKEQEQVEKAEEEQAEEWNIGAPTEDGAEVKPKDVFAEPATTTETKPATPVKKQQAEPAEAPQPAPKPTRHVVKQGETLYGISRMYAVTVNDLTTWNKLGDAPIRIGQELFIAAPLAEPEQETTAEEDLPATLLSTNNGYHTVVAGETLYQISKKYGVSLEDLRNWNNLTDNNIRLNQELRVQAPEGAAAPTQAQAPESSPETSAVPSTGYHTVAGGESMYQISRKYGVTIKDIMEWNNKSDFSVSVGEKLRIKQK